MLAVTNISFGCFLSAFLLSEGGGAQAAYLFGGRDELNSQSCVIKKEKVFQLHGRHLQVR